MAYTRNPTWQDSPSAATPITAATLNALEAGLVNAANVADSSITALANKEPAISRAGATAGQVPVLQAGGTLAFATPAAGGGTVAAATTTTQGIVQLAGDLAGTAAAPTVPALTTKLSSTDPSVTNARTPLAHKASHATGGADLLLPSDIGAATAASVTANTTAIATKAPLLIPTVVKTAAYTAVSGDLVMADATTASFAVTLPAAAVGLVLAIKKVDSSVNTITITPAGTDTIDGLTSAVLRLPNATQRLIAVATGWVVADGFNALTALDARYIAVGTPVTINPQTAIAPGGGGYVTRGVTVPAGSLETWRTARANAATALAEIVIFGDSTTSGSCYDSTNYSWIHKLRQLLTGVSGDGGVGNPLLPADYTTDPTPNLLGDIASVVSKTGFAGAHPNSQYSIHHSTVSSNVSTDTITYQGKVTTIRISYNQMVNYSGKFRYQVDGGTWVTVDASSKTFSGDTLLAASGLDGNTHTLTVQPLGYGSSFTPTFYNATPSASTATSSLAPGAYKYAVTRAPNAGTGESAPVYSNSVTTATGQVAVVTMNNDSSGGIYKFYRQTGGTGSYLYIASVTKPSGGGQAVFTDDGTATPGAVVPTVDTSQDTAIAWVGFVPDFVKSTGVVIYRNATSGISTNSYFSTSNATLGNLNAEIALGLKAGVNTAQAEQYGWNSPKQTTYPRYRKPALAICALGVNDMQGTAIAAGDGGPTAAESTTAVINANIMKTYLYNFVRMTRQAGADPLIVVPHLDLAQYTHFWAGLFGTAITEVARATGTACVDFNEAVRPVGTMSARGLGPIAVHSAIVTYDTEATLLYNKALSL